MKISKFFIRIWITVVAVGSFVAGWVFFAHSNKPASLFTSQPAQAAAVVNQPNFRAQSNFNNNDNGFLFSSPSNSTIFRRRMRTGGS
jgi:hypothetical protein